MQYFTKTQVASMIHKSVSSVTQYFLKGILQASCKKGKTWLFSERSVQALQVYLGQEVTHEG